jgi:uncharacterized membrane protein
MSDAVFAVAFATALGTGLAAGVFFAFSSFVMPALGKLPPPQAIAAMQSINRLALTPVFMTALLGAAAVCAVAIAVSLPSLGEPYARRLLAGAVLYLAGTIGVTRICNVPRNVALDRVEPGSAEAAAYWSRYLAEWTRWNHVRTAAALAGCALAIAAIRG